MVMTGTRRDAPPSRRPAGDRLPAAYDAVVVGARVAGASTAMLMAREGLRVLLLERAPAPGTDTLSTLALMRGGVLQLARWGMLDSVRAAGTPAVRTTLVHYGEETVTVPIQEKAGVGELFAPRRTLLDRVLVEGAAAAGVEVRFGAAVDGLRWEHGRVTGVDGRDRNGHRFEARAALVVGADGHTSGIARAVAPEVTWRGRASGGVLFALYTDLPVEGFEWFYREGATAGFMPTNDGLTLAWVGVPTARFHAEVRRDLEAGFGRLLREAASEALERVGAARRAGPLRGFPGSPGYLRRPWGPGWALVGDAGSFRDPLSAHGMTDAMRDAELLARAALAHAADPAAGAMAGYERDRDEVAVPLAEITEALASYRWSLAEVNRILKSLSRAMGREVERLAALGTASTAAA